LQIYKKFSEIFYFSQKNILILQKNKKILSKITLREFFLIKVKQNFLI